MEIAKCVLCGAENSMRMGGEPICFDCDFKREEALAEKIRSLNPPPAPAEDVEP